MPITQERFMTVITGAKSVMLLHRAIKDSIRRINAEIAMANSAIEHTQDIGAREALTELTKKVMAIREMFLEYGDTSTDELMAIILAEELHFKKAARKNTKARYYQSDARQKRGAIPRQQQELTQPTQHSAPIGEISSNNTILQSRQYKEFAQEQVRNWNKTADPAVIKPIIEAEIKEAEAIYGPLNLDIRAQRELELMRNNARALPTGPWPTGEYVAGRICTTMPKTQEEMDADAIEPETNVL